MGDDFKFDVFLSHSAKDKPVVRELAARVWLDAKPSFLSLRFAAVSPNGAMADRSPVGAADGRTWPFRNPLNQERRFIPLLLANCKLPDTLRRYKYADYQQETYPAASPNTATSRR